MHTLYWRPNVCHYCSLNGISGIHFTVVLYYCITRKLGLQISLDLQHFHRIFFHQNMHFFFNFKKALVLLGLLWGGNALSPKAALSFFFCSVFRLHHQWPSWKFKHRSLLSTYYSSAGCGVSSTSNWLESNLDVQWLPVIGWNKRV